MLQRSFDKVEQKSVSFTLGTNTFAFILFFGRGEFIFITIKVISLELAHLSKASEALSTWRQLSHQTIKCHGREPHFCASLRQLQGLAH